MWDLLGGSGGDLSTLADTPGKYLRSTYLEVGTYVRT